MAGSIFKASACSLAVSAMLACLSASAQQQSTRPPDTGKPTTGATQGTPKSAADQSAPTGKQATTKVARADRKFIEEATEGGLAEVELGKLAQQKSQSTMVKEFGSRMVQDHGKANDELKEIAESKGVQLPGAPDKSHQKDVDKLSKLSGAEFDREYAAHMLSDHKKDVSEFKKAAEKSKDSDLKAFAGKTLPTLQEHLTLAQNLNDSVKGKKQ
jgi:putative membrane protein